MTTKAEALHILRVQIDNRMENLKALRDHAVDRSHEADHATARELLIEARCHEAARQELWNVLITLNDLQY